MSFFRGLFVVVAMLGVAIFSTGAFAAVPLTMTHQGRLLDAGDKPVNGFFDITYRIFEAPTGGSPLWTELHASVQVADGLFSALLGSTVPLSADVLGNGGGGGGGGLLSPRYLEVSVGGTTLSPRLALSSVPSAVSAGHVSGDIETEPGMFTVTNTGGATTGALRMKATPDSAVTHLEDDPDHDGSAQSKIDQTVTHLNSKIDMARDVNNDGVMDMSVEMATDNDSASLRLNGLPPGIPVTGTLSMSASGTGARSALEGRSGSTTGTIRMMATPDSASEVMEKKGLNAINVKLARTISSPPGGLVAADAIDMDSDNDGVMDRSVSTGCDATGARSILKGGMSGSTTGTIRMMATPDSAVNALDEDSDGDGIPESSVKQKSGHGSASSTILGGMSGSTTGTIRMQATGGGPVMPSGDILLAADLDGDGVPEVTSADSVDAAGASRRLKSSGIGSSGNDGVEVQLSARPSGGTFKAIQTKGTGASGMVRSCAGTADSVAATILLEADLDGDGVMENTSVDSVDANGAMRRLKSSGIGSSGNDGVEVQLSARPGSGSFRAINTKGTGEKLRCSAGADSSKAGILLEADTDGDGVPEGEISQIVTPTTTSVAIKTKGTGAEANKSASLTVTGSPGGSISAVCAADLDGDGVMDRQVSSTVDSGQAGIAIDEPGVQVAMGMRKGWDGTIKGRFTVDEGATRKIELNSNGDGYLAGKIGIGKDPIEKIDVAGGAYCDGTNWVNASDRNSKENFTAVDGNELLEQIAQLSITRWNYKGNNEAEHIGPTAQDFKAAFGVGADDKSISTIDPSGIALAAIKALNNQMQELNAKTTQLENQAREISQLKGELDAIKAMLQKQATTKN